MLIVLTFPFLLNFWIVENYFAWQDLVLVLRGRMMLEVSVASRSSIQDAPRRLRHVDGYQFWELEPQPWCDRIVGIGNLC